MPEPITVGASDASQLVTPTPADRVARAAALLAPKTEAPAPEPTAPIADPAPETPKPAPLKDAIAEMRARREREAAEAQRKASFEAENAKLKQELEAIKAASQFEDDPVAYAKARGWDREQQLMFGKALIYDLAPDQADPNFRVSMFEAKQKREEKAKAESEAKAKAESEQRSARETFTKFTQDLEAGVMDFTAGSYPESEAWYGDDVEGYLRDMVQTAIRMANTAKQEGKVADLTPPAIAAALEADTSRRLAERDKRRAMREPSQGTQQSVTTPTVDAEAEQSLDSVSSKSMSGSGTPLPPARSEAERIQRAIAVAFPKR